ncbi:MAG: hypothetical protein M4579_001110 [Chaenotheca gracillima]|nr:MAG: hypothetical protein M4579_001110 [Chaenotheca gracillima]
MATLAVPDAGLALLGAPDVDIGSTKPDKRPTQIIGLDLPDHLLDEILKAVKNGPGGAKGLHLSLGRTPSLQYGHQTRDFASVPESVRHEVYHQGAGKSDLSFAGVVGQRLDIRKPEEVTAGADAAMLALQNSMAAIDKEKKSNQTLFVPDNSKLPPAMSKRAAAKPKNSAGLFKVNRSQIFGNNATTKSLPTSPSHGPVKSPSLHPQSQPPTSIPMGPGPNVAKAQALRTPLIHLLACGSTTEREIIKTTRCSKDVVRSVLDKVAKSVGTEEKWRLNDRAYKELDVWGFNYPAQEQRQAAIDNSVSAFDRQRLSKSDPLWQRLLPGDERGKGKVLSKLHHLHQGPMMLNNNLSNAPSIKVQSMDDEHVSTDNAMDGATDLSETGDPLRVPTLSQEMKRSTSQPIAPRKKKVSERESLSKRLLSNSKNPKKPAKRATKQKEAKAPEVKESSKIKSAEFVHDSDEESEEEDFLDNGSKAVTETETASLHPASAEDQDETKPSPEKTRRQNSESPPSKSTSSQSSKPSQTSPPKRDSTGRPRTGSSPQKPSPLGSSPPTNASELDSERFYHASSSSSTRSNSQHSKGASTPTPMPSRKAARPTSVKREADEHAPPPAKRVRSDIHHPQPKQQQQQQQQRHTAPVPRPVNGPIDDSTSSGASPPAMSNTVMQARKFKEYHAKYAKLHAELSRQAEPPQERVRHLLKMHERLEVMKRNIFQAAGVRQ